MSGYQWLLMLHVTGAFFLLGGSLIAALLQLLALRSNRPSEIAQLLGLVRVALPVLLLGALMTLVLGVWLVHHVGYSYGTFWVWAALVLWVVGERPRQVRRRQAGSRPGSWPSGSRAKGTARAPSCARCCATRSRTS